MTNPNRAYNPEAETRPSLLTRRDFIRRTVQMAVAGAVIPGTLTQVLPAVAPDALGGVGPGPVIVRDETTNAKTPVTLADLEGETPVVLTAEWNFLPAVVYKVDRSILEASTEYQGYNTAQFAVEHPTEKENAIMVYDGKCKHLGCTVGWNAGLGGAKPGVGKPDYNEDGVLDGRILCPCHQGQYDIYNLALNQPATPPPEPLNVVEFDVKPWADDVTGASFADVIHGEEKHIQTGPKEAAGKGILDLSGPAFNMRAAGWSL